MTDQAPTLTVTAGTDESLRGLITAGQGQPTPRGVRLSPGEKPIEVQR